MIKKGTRYLLLPLLFLSICVYAGVIFVKPARIVKVRLSQHRSDFKTVKPAKKTNIDFAGSITVFTIPGQLSDAVFTPTATPNSYIIGIAVHAGTDITNITPHVEKSSGSTIDPFPTDIPTDFTGSKLYTIDPAGPVTVHYNVQVLAASAASVCASAPITLAGSGTPPGTFKWQQLQTDNTWADAPGANQNTDYYVAGIANTSGSPKIFTFRRAITFGGTTYDSYTDLTVNPVIPITGNTITQPPALNSTFCVTGNPGTIQGNDAVGGDNNPKYQWQSSVGGAPFENISGANGRDYAPGQISATTKFRRIVKAGDCTPPTISNQVTITIQNAIANNYLFPLTTTTFCGTSVPLSLQGSNATGGDNGTYSYQWQSKTEGGTFADISGATSHDYNSPAVTQTTYFQRLVKSGACSTPVPTDNVITITIQRPLSPNTITPTGITSFCATGDPTVIKGSPVTGGDGTPVYFWESSTDGNTYQPISGTNQQNYDPPPVSVTTYFRRQVSSGSCSPPTPSTPVVISVTPAITANNIHAANTVFCVSTGAFTITGDPAAGGDGSFTYGWQSSTDGVNYRPINGAASPSYNSPSLTEDTWFQRIVSSGACNGTSVSTAVKITVYKAWAENNITATGPASFCETGDATTITGSVPAGGDGSPQYQWQQSPDNIDAHFTDINGQTGKDFDPPNVTITTFYRRVVKGLICTAPLISTPVEIHITPPIVASSNTINAPLITTFCTSVDPATIIGSLVQGGDGPASIQYQWQLSTDNGTTWSNVAGNGTQPDYDPDPITETTQYRRVVTSGACTIQIPSMQVVTLTIIDSPPNITINSAAPICAGERAILSIASPDAALTYNWYDTPTRDNLLFQGPVFTTGALTANQTFYAEASNGTCSSPQLASVDVTVNPLPAVPVLADAAPTGCKGATVSLKVDNLQNGVTYKWYSTATGGTALFTGAEFTTPALSDNAIYYVEATNTSGCISESRASAVITVYPLPVATALGASICPGTAAVITANNPDPDLLINWYTAPTGGTPVASGSTFTTPVLNNTTSYYAEAVNTVSGCVSATRAEATVQMLAPLPSPVVHVAASAAPNITFVWTPVTGAVAYRISTDNGASYIDPSTGADGTSHTVTGLQVGQTVTIIVRALGNTSCETSADSNPVTGVAAEPNVDKIFVANAFTPNGDGKNDIVYVHNDNIKSLKFSVYDQWGNLLFQSLSPQKGWDGTYKGKLQPVGVYIYYLEAMMNDGQPVTKKGTITLLR